MPTIVCEVSANHRGNLIEAQHLVEDIAQAGAKYVKFQTYTPDSMTMRSAETPFRISNEHPLWGGQTLYDLYSEASTPWEWHEELFRHARSLGLTPFSTPFDISAVDFLETLNPAMYKIASLEIGDLPLVRHVAQTQRPMIISTGAATLEEVDEAVHVAQVFGSGDLTLLLCTSAYPTNPQEVHLRRMETLRTRYGVPVGLSDHTVGIDVSIAAAALGAALIERHVTRDRAQGGPDAAFSLEAREIPALIKGVESAALSLGASDWLEIEAETESRRLKRSLFVTRDCTAGEIINEENVRSIRPNGGLPPRYLDTVTGRTFSRSVRAGTPLTWDLVTETSGSS